MQSKANYLSFAKKPESERVLVLAPHPDDESIGCGGVLYQHYLSGEKITVVFLTDGCQGRYRRRISEEEIVKQRKEEAKKAAVVLGIQNIIFWDYKDGELCSNEESIKRMRELIPTITPDVVYLPYFVDEHEDHWATNKIFLEACPKITYRFKVFAYEVWTPLIPNYLVNITKQMDKKLKALECYKTQIETF
ncbi:MAG: PIG-L deacetylase family protein [bacterium]|nr:PIG-L deacetylase family protein [bacterium]